MKFNKIWLWALLILGVFVFEAGAKADKSIDYECSEVEGKLFCLDEKGKPLTGKWEKYDLHGNRTSIENFKNGYFDGLCSYFADGRIAERQYYKQGVRNGQYKKFYLNRTFQITAEYSNGLLDGKIDLMYPNGKLHGRMTYKAGKLKRGYCIDEDGKKTDFSEEIIAQYQNNKINMCGMK